MKLPAKYLFPGISARFLLALLVAVLFVVVFMLMRHSLLQPKPQPVAQAQPATTNSLPKPEVTNKMNSPAATPAALANYPDFQVRPFAVAYESPQIRWTQGDGKDTNVIRHLAHNHLEYDRMVEENPRIFRRQLVYLKELAGAVFEEAKLTGKPVQLLTLPVDTTKGSVFYRLVYPWSQTQ
jgi:hypothetical protein